MNGVVIVSSPKDLIRKDNPSTLYLLPYRLRMVRATHVDNGFSGVRTVSSQAAFLQDLQNEAQMHKDNPHYLPEDIENGSSPETDHPGAAFGAIVEGEYMTVSPGHNLKYIVCNPEHFWVLAIHDGILLLYPCTEKTAKKEFKVSSMVTVAGLASFV